MNVAEDIRDPRLIELHKLRAAALIQSQIEAFAIEQGEHIVKKRIVVGKLHLAARWNHNQQGMETFVLLHQLRNLRRVLYRWSRRGSRSNRRQPDNHLRCITQGASAAS